MSQNVAHDYAYILRRRPDDMQMSMQRSRWRGQLEAICSGRWQRHLHWTLQLAGIGRGRYLLPACLRITRSSAAGLVHSRGLQ